MNAPAKFQWSEARFGADTQHWLPRNDERVLDHIPGEDGMPLLGTTLDQLKDPMRFSPQVEKWSHK